MSTATRYPTTGLEPKKQRQTAPLQSSGATFDFEDRPDPKKIELADGEVFTGILANVERVTVGTPPKPAMRYTFAEIESGETFFTLGTYQLDSKIRPTDRGHVIEIRFEGLDENVGRAGNQMKKYHIRVSKRTAQGWADNGTPITEEDLPAEAFLA